MKILLKSITIIDQSSKHHLKVRDVLVADGIIKKIAEQINNNDYKTVKGKGLHVCPSFIDLNTHVFEPGLEYREDIQSTLKTASAAGYGAICVMPNTNPPIDNKTSVDFLKNASRNKLTQLLPLGGVSHHIDGEHLAEIYDMYNSGAVAFTDGDKPIQQAGLMERALLYVKKINGIVYSFPYDESISNGGQMNEGITSTRLGLHASSNLAEDIMVARDLYLLEYTQSKLHFMQISTKKSVDLIRKAKAKGLHVSAGVNVANLYFNDSHLQHFNTSLKVHPHLRDKEDVEALLEGLKDGTIDVINSGHKPLHQDEKKVEFANALFGASTLDCVFSAARTVSNEILTETELIQKFINGFKILNIPLNQIEENADARLTILNLTEKHTFTEEMINSKGKNNPFIGEQLEGKVIGLISKNITNLL